MGHGRCPGEDITDKGISIIIHNYLIDTCTGIFHGLHCHCNWWARFVISYFDTCPIDKEQQQQQPLSTTRSISTFTILSLTTKSPQATSLPNHFLSAPKKKKSRTIPTGCVVTISEATPTYTYLTHQQLPNYHPPNHHNALVTHLPSPHSPRRPPLPPKIPHRPSSPLVSPPPPPPPPSHVHNTLQQSPPHQTISRTFSHLSSPSPSHHHHNNINININVNDENVEFTTSSQSSILFSYCSREKYV